MTEKRNYLTKTIFFATCLALGCSSSGTLGCGSSSSEEAPTVDSNLPAVYQITSYQGNEDGCDEVADVPMAPPYLVLYAFHPNSAPNETRLGGTFCSSVEECRGIAEFAGEPSTGYSFIMGDDDAGWTGFAILSNGPIGETDQCRAEVQVHELTVPGAQALSIETRTVETTYMPMVDGTTASCRNLDAVASINDDLPCQALLLLEATREAEL
jgi:hypothetical protein